MSVSMEIWLRFLRDISYRLGCMFKTMSKEAPNNWFQNLKQPSEQEITIFQFFFSPFYFGWLHKKLRVIISLFRSRLLSFIRPNQSSIYNIFDPICLKLLTCPRLVLSHLNKHKFRHNFQDCLNRLCSCSLEIEDTTHYCQHFSNRR